MTSSAIIRRLPLRPTPGSRSSTLRSLYHSYEHEPPAAYPANEEAILSAALKHVSQYGFTREALTSGANDAGYLDISTNLFPKGVFELVRYHLITQRLGLQTKVQFPEQRMGVGIKVRTLILERLRGNAEADVVRHWQNALGIMSLAENIPASLSELARLSDEIWFLAGDTAVNTSWYTKRASLAGVYASAEVYQSQDQSSDFTDTEAFLDRRLEEVRVFGGAVSNTFQWAGFQAGALVNLLRSKGARI